MSGKYYCLREYNYLYSDEFTSLTDDSNVLLKKSEFDEIEHFVLMNSNDKEENVAQFLVPGYKKGIGKILKAQNYVGLIQTKNNTVIEILPKLYDKDSTISYEKTIAILLRMLRSLKDSPFKSFSMSNIGTSNMNLLQIFIKMFLEELGILIKKRIKSGYLSLQENANYYKGKLLVKEHIARNIVHKERFYTEHDDYIRNRPENRIIKATLVYLNNVTNNYKLQGKIREYIFALEDVEVSMDIEADFNKCNSNRLLSDYDIILKWCRIFLKKQSFTNYKGQNKAYSLLFPMEKIFESYVAKAIKESEYFTDYNIKTQDSKYYLIEKPNRFSLRPDIVLEKNNEVFILDTKWKLLNNSESGNYGISQSDLYQMYAYAKKYKSNNLFLLYPLNDFISNLKSKIFFEYEDNLKLSIVFINLEDISESLKDLADCIS
jgi:5-methylcytosine-specific restriction enzyme subunit McrC